MALSFRTESSLSWLFSSFYSTIIVFSSPLSSVPGESDLGPLFNMVPSCLTKLWIFQVGMYYFEKAAELIIIMI